MSRKCNIPATLQRHCTTTLFAVLACIVAPPWAQAQVVLEPGGQLQYAVGTLDVVPDAIEGSTSFFRFGDAIIVTDDDPQVPAPLDTRVVAQGALSRAAADLLQYVEFTVAHDPAGTSPGRVLTAQLSGHVDIRGFLTLIGLGQSELDVTLEVVEVFGEGGQLFVHSQPLGSYELMGTFQPSVAAGFGVEVGSATFGQAGVGAGGELGLNLQKQVVRDMVPFGFQVLLRRGETYRVQLVASSQVKLGVAGGSGQVTFSPSFDVPTNVFEVAEWIDSLEIPMLDEGFRNLDLPRTPGARFSFPTINTLLTDIGGFDVSIANGSLFPGITTSNTLNTIRTQFNLPETAREALVDFYGSPTGRVEEGIAEPGIHFRSMQILLEQDTAEQLDQLSATVGDHVGNNEGFDALSQQLDDLSVQVAEHDNSQDIEALTQQVNDLSTQMAELRDLLSDHATEEPEEPAETPEPPRRPVIDFFLDIFR